MTKIKSFFQQEIFPGFYTSYVNKILTKDYEKEEKFDVDISSSLGKEKEYIDRIRIDLENQLERKKRIEDKAKSLLFIIAVAITAITFSLTYLNSLTIDIYQAISIGIVFLSIIYMVMGAIRALQTLNIRKFNGEQVEIDTDKDKDKYILKPNLIDDNYLKEIIKYKQLNNLINVRLTNYTYASFNLIRNGIILFVLFFISTIIFTYISKKESIITQKIGKETKINDNINCNSFVISIDSLTANNKIAIKLEGQNIDSLINSSIERSFTSGSLAEKHKKWTILNPILIGFTILFLFFAFIVKNKRLKYCFIVSSVLTMGAKFVFEPEFTIKPQIKIEVNTSKPLQSTFLSDTLNIRSFKSGFDILDSLGITRLEELKTMLLNASKNFLEIDIYGGVDKRPLRRKSLIKFGDNLTLAQARANYIKNYITKILYQRKIPQLNITINGANSYTETFDSIGFANSRCVKVVIKYTLNK